MSSARRALDEDDYDDFEERTIIGPAQELAAKSMAEPDPVPQPVVTRASTKNVVRRTGPVGVPIIPRASGEMPAVRAAGSGSELTVPPAKTDDDAFEPWDDFEAAPSKTPSAPPAPELVRAIAAPSVVVEAPIEEPVDERIEAPPSIVIEEPAPPQPAQVAPANVTPAKRSGMRWGVAAWFVLLAAMIAGGGFAYMKILDLEHELALTRSALEAEKLR